MGLFGNDEKQRREQTERDVEKAKELCVEPDGQKLLKSIFLLMFLCTKDFLVALFAVRQRLLPRTWLLPSEALWFTSYSKTLVAANREARKGMQGMIETLTSRFVERSPLP